MADFIARIKPKKSSVAGESPLAADLDVAEIAVNTADGKLFVKHTDGSIKEISGSGGGSAGTADGSVRTSAPQVTTAQLAKDSSEDVTFTQTGRAGQFLKIEASCASWVVFYTSQAARTADAGRLSTENPDQGAGVLMEVFFDQAETALITPSVLYFNNDANQGAEIYAKVTNLDPATQAVTITATVVPIEGRAVYEAEGTVRSKPLSVTTSLIADAVSEDLTLDQTARSGQFITLESSHAARVIFYSNKAARTADASRPQGVSPVGGSGVLLEVVTTGAETLEITPAVLYQNTESGAAGELYMSVTNLSGADAEVEIITTVVPIEGRGAYLSEFHELLDVDTTGAIDGDGIVYDATSSKWIPGASSSVSALDDLSDVDTTGAVDGDGIVYDATASKWIPGASSSVSAFDDLSDVTTVGFSALQSTDFEAGSQTFIQPSAGATGGSVDSTLGTNAYKVVATDYYGDGSHLQSMFRLQRRYDIVNLKIRSSNEINTNNRLSLGGTKPGISAGAGWTFYTRDSGFGFYLNGAYQELGTRPTMSANTWYEITYVLDWGDPMQRVSPPTVSLWVDGAIAVDNTTLTSIYSELVDGTEADFYLAYSSSALGNSGDKYWDDIRTTSTENLPWAMSDATITGVPAAMDAIVENPGKGDSLVYTGSQWMPSSSVNAGAISLALNDLSDVSVDSNGTLTIDNLDGIDFKSSDVPANQRWGIYSNSIYGVAIGEYDLFNNSSSTRLFLDPGAGPILNSGRTKLHWLMGAFSSTSEEPELRWTSGNPGATFPTGNYIGLKLPAGLSGDMTYELPLVDGTAGQVLSTDGAGVTSWIDSGGSGGGGGGAVDSVNGETGVVSLGVFDLSDVDYNYTSLGWTWVATDLSSSTSGLANGKALGDSGAQVSVSPISDDGDDAKAALRAWSVANPAPFSTTVSVDGVVTNLTITGWTDNMDTSGTYNPRLRMGTASGGSPVISVGAVVALPGFDTWADANGYGRPGTVAATLLEDDILQWDSATQTFKPAQLPAGGGGGAIDSVNGETGVVSLGIQEMDDFELNPVTGAPSYNVKASTFPSGPGEYQRESSTSIRISPISADGTDYTTELENHTGTVWYLVDGVDLSSSTYTGWAGTYGRVNVSGGGDPDSRSSYQIFFADPGAPPYSTPLAEGDILQWNDVDQKFKPAQLPDVPIDSVNGETGAVSLGIQEMVDFELNQIPAVGYTYSSGATVSDSGDPGYARYATNFSNPKPFIINEEDSSGTNLRNALLLLSAGDKFWWSFDGGFTFEEFTIDTTAQGVAGRWDLRPTVSPSGSWVSNNDSPWERGSDWQLFFAEPTGAQDVPLAEADILKWDNSDQKFKPAQLPSAAPVDSVNGEIGVVSLGIQEMDDYSGAPTSVEVDLGRWDVNVGGSFPDQGGEWRNFDSTTNDVWQFYKEDVFGDDYSAELLALVTGDVVQVSTDSGSTYGISVTLIADAVFSTGNGGNTTISITLSDTDGAKLTGLTGINLRITEPGPDAPLVEGDILQWDNAAQKFKPAQLPAAPVDSVNGETGVVSLGVQDMDDFNLNITTTSISIDYDTNIGAGGAAPGGAGRFSPYDLNATEILLMVDHEDASGSDALPDLASWAALTNKFLTIDGVTVEVTLNSFIARADRYDLNIAKAGGLQADLLAATTVTLQNLPSTPIPLVDGDILQWVDADQKFKPAQLSAAPVDSVNGETGVVSLGIQDMDDYEADNYVPNTNQVIQYTYTNDPDVSGGYDTKTNTSFLEFNTTDADGNAGSLANLIAGWSSNDPIYISVDEGVTWYQKSFRSSQIGADTILLEVHGGWSDPTGSYVTASTLWFGNYAGLPGSAFAPAEGDILRWNDSAQKFKLAQSSVNGETGVVSLGIQDMNDYEGTPTSVEVDLGEWDSNTGATFPDQSGEWGMFDGSTKDTWRLYKEDSLGDDYSAELLALVTGDVVQVSTDGGSTYGISVTLIEDAIYSTALGGNTIINIVLSNTDGAKLPTGIGLTAINLRITQPGPYAPPAEGDILQWNNADQKFKPAQLPAAPVDANSHTLPQVFGIAAHASFDASAGGSFDFATDTIASGNISGITRTDTGKFTISFTNAFASNAYTAVCTAGDEDYSGSGASPRCVNVVSRSAGSMDIVVERSDDAVQDDEGYIAVMVIGLLA